jgi:hypothetical protein
MDHRQVPAEGAPATITRKPGPAVGGDTAPGPLRTHVERDIGMAHNTGRLT